MRLSILIGVAALLAPSLYGQDTSALINQQLDQQVKLDLNGTLQRSLDEIKNKTGVTIKPDQAVWDLLPWGQETTVAAKIENQTLRQALTAITRRLGLSFQLKDQFVELQPMPALRRLGRRSTVDELEALNLLASTPMSLATDRPSVKQLVDAVDAKLVELKSPYAVEYRAASVAKPDQVVFVPRNATMMEALESLSKDTGATWYPWDKSIVIIGKEDEVRMQLARTISTRYPGTDVAQVLLELSQRAGVPFEIEPGAIARIPAASRSIRLILTNASIREALETIVGFTGLGFVVRDSGVYIWNQQNNPPAGARDRVIGILTLSDINLQVLLPESQVPPDLREYIQYKTQKEFTKLRRLMKEENFTPATRPTTQE